MTNKEILAHVYDELSRGNSRPLLERMADDVVWTVKGGTRWSGTYRGKAAVLSDLIAVLRARLDGHYKATAERILADGPFVVVQARAHAVAKNGTPYGQEYCFVYRLEDGAIKEIIEYMDTELVTRALGDAQ